MDLKSLVATPRRNNERYATDPVYREKAISRAKAWNAANPDKKRTADKKWASANAAAAQRRYRAKKAKPS